MLVVVFVVHGVEILNHERYESAPHHREHQNFALLHLLLLHRTPASIHDLLQRRLPRRCNLPHC